MKWFRKAAQQGHSEAANTLAVGFQRGLGVQQDYSEAAKWYRVAADQDYAIAQMNLGTLYYRGDGVPKDLKEAIKWLRKAAEKEDPEAQLILGLHLREEGIEQSEVEAVNWIRKSAEKGNATAQRALAGFLLSGRGTPVNYLEAYKWAIVSQAKAPHDAVDAAVKYLEARLTQEERAEGQRSASSFWAGHGGETSLST
jgi:TPR repeat protein